MSDNIASHEEQTHDGRIIGRNPTKIPLHELGQRMELIDVIRERCIDCKDHCKPRIEEEIRECRNKSCASWPYRMGVDPWAKPRPKKIVEKKRVVVKSKNWIYE